MNNIFLKTVVVCALALAAWWIVERFSPDPLLTRLLQLGIFLAVVSSVSPAPGGVVILTSFCWHCITYVILAAAALSLLGCATISPVAKFYSEPFEYVDPLPVDDLIYRGPVLRPRRELGC